MRSTGWRGAFVFVCALTFGLAACGGAAPATNGPTSTAGTSATTGATGETPGQTGAATPTLAATPPASAAATATAAGTPTASGTPNATSATATSIGLNRSMACALLIDGSVMCWGSGLLGDGSTSNNTSPPVRVSNLGTGVKAISVGASFACALTSAGGVKCRGDNTLGELGNGSMPNSPTPVDVTGLTSGATAISAGAAHACAVMSAGQSNAGAGTVMANSATEQQPTAAFQSTSRALPAGRPPSERALGTTATRPATHVRSPPPVALSAGVAIGADSSAMAPRPTATRPSKPPDSRLGLPRLSPARATRAASLLAL